MLKSISKDISFRLVKIVVPLFGAAYAAPNKGTTILCFSRTFQCKFYFQGLFKIVLYIQVLFKPVRTLCMNNHPTFLSSRVPLGMFDQEASCLNIFLRTRQLQMH